MRGRFALVVVLMVSGLVAAPAQASWRPDVRAARAYVAHRAGDVSFSVRTQRHLYSLGGYRVARSASVVKAMLLVSYLDRRQVRGRRLNRRDRALLGPMIQRSDNAAASRVRDIVGNGALTRLARQVGMRRFATAGSFGATQICAADQAAFFLKVDRYVVTRHRRYAMHLLNTVTASQRWGVARARPHGWAIYFKGGWGSGSGAVDHQVALVRRGDRRVSLAILTTGNPTKAYGDATLQGVARRLLRGLRANSIPR